MHTLSGFVHRLQSLRGVAGPAGRVTPRRATTEPAVLLDDAEQLARGCGWFDSSHALHCGLRVTEHASPDTLAEPLPLEAWLELHLAGRIPARAVHAD